MIRDLIVPVTGTTGDDNALAAAIAMARPLDAHVCVAQTVVVPMPSVPGYPVMPNVADLYAQQREQADRDADRFRAVLAREGPPHEVRLVEALFLTPAAMVALHARHADLAVMASPGTRGGFEGEVVRRFFAALLFESGRPVVVVPEGHAFEWPIARAVVAWKPTREATRALHDALPLLRQAARIDVVSVDPRADEFQYGALPGADIAAHLARHGFDVNVLELPREGHSASTVLLRHCAEMGAQLLVAGGFGHTRAREWMLGGATRELLQHAALPVLFSH